MPSPRICDFTDCGRAHSSLGLCNAHDMQRRRGRPLRALPAQPKSCLVRECDRPTRSLGLCVAHYRQTREGRELTPAGSLEERGAWSESPSGYLFRKVTVGGRVVKVSQHRQVMETSLGRSLLPDESVHHRNGVRNDNRLENLELWSTSQPAGQRVEDKIDWAREILRRYGAD